MVNFKDTTSTGSRPGLRGLSKYRQVGGRDAREERYHYMRNGLHYLDRLGGKNVAILGGSGNVPFRNQGFPD